MIKSHPQTGYLRQTLSAGVMRPNFFIVGAPKCGTSALAHYLSTHPEIFVAKKEMHFFGSDLKFGPQFYRRDLSAYLAEFKGSKKQIHIGEASVWYLFSERAAAEIKKFNPQARIIIMLREPVAMLHSLYYQFRADGNEHLPTFKEALDAELNRRTGAKISKETYLSQALQYRAVACFSRQVRRFFDVFGRDRVHVVMYDDFSSDTAKTYADALIFLGISSLGPMTSFKVVNENKFVRYAPFRAFLNGPHVRGSILAGRSWLPRPVFTAAEKLGAWLNHFNYRVDKRPVLPNELKNSLRAEFAGEVEQLSRLLGRDLTHWSEMDMPSLPVVSGHASAQRMVSLNPAQVV